jgi:hypothetical protein
MLVCDERERARGCAKDGAGENTNLSSLQLPRLSWGDDLAVGGHVWLVDCDCLEAGGEDAHAGHVMVWFDRVGLGGRE